MNAPVQADNHPAPGQDAPHVPADIYHLALAPAWADAEQAAPDVLAAPDAPASPEPLDPQGALPATPTHAQTRSPSTQFSFINPNINSEDNEHEPVENQFQKDQVVIPEMAKTKSNPKKKSAKLPYPKKNQEIFFRIRNVISYGKFHPKLVARYGTKWAKVQIQARVYANSQGCGPYFNFIDCVDDSFHGGVHLDQTDWAFATERPLPRTLADSIHNYMVESDPDPTDAYIIHISRDQWHTPEVREAMEKELKNFSQFDVYDLVEDIGQAFITSG